MICRKCGNFMRLVETFGDNYNEPLEEHYICECGVEVWKDCCYESWSYDNTPDEKEVEKLYQKLLEDGVLDLSEYDDPMEVWDMIDNLAETDGVRIERCGRDYRIKVEYKEE